MVLNRSELISKLSSKFKSFTASDIDYSVKKDKKILLNR